MAELKLPRRQFLHLAAGAAALPAMTRIANAQAYPSRPITIVVGAAAGGPTDTIARKKRASAVALAIRDAKLEFANSDGTVVVTCLEGRKLETVWKGTQ